MEVFRGCAGWAGEGSEKGKVGDIVRTTGEYVVLALTALFVGRPVIELTIFACIILYRLMFEDVVCYSTVATILALRVLPQLYTSILFLFLDTSGLYSFTRHPKSMSTDARTQR